MSNTEAEVGRGPSAEEMLAMRTNVINEIIATERDFVRDLSTIMEV